VTVPACLAVGNALANCQVALALGIDLAVAIGRERRVAVIARALATGRVSCRVDQAQVIVPVAATDRIDRAEVIGQTDPGPATGLASFPAVLVPATDLGLVIVLASATGLVVPAMDIVPAEFPIAIAGTIIDTNIVTSFAIVCAGTIRIAAIGSDPATGADIHIFIGASATTAGGGRLGVPSPPGYPGDGPNRSTMTTVTRFTTKAIPFITATSRTQRLRNTRTRPP